MTTLAYCTLLAVAQAGNKTVITDNIRLKAQGRGFKVYKCLQTQRATTTSFHTTATGQKLIIDNSRPLRRYKVVGSNVEMLNMNKGR